MFYWAITHVIIHNYCMWINPSKNKTKYSIRAVSTTHPHRWMIQLSDALGRARLVRLFRYAYPSLSHQKLLAFINQQTQSCKFWFGWLPDQLEPIEVGAPVEPQSPLEQPLLLLHPSSAFFCWDHCIIIHICRTFKMTLRLFCGRARPRWFP